MARRKRGHFNVEPRYTPGSPAQVPEYTALRVAAQEKDAIEGALEGIWGEEAKARAEERGLDLIVFEMVERPKGWDVHDLITDKHYFWPFKGQCPTCKTKKVECRRGHLQEHYYRSSDHRTYGCTDRSFVGHEVNREL